MPDEHTDLNKSRRKVKQHGDNGEIDELRRALLKMPMFGTLAYSGMKSVGVAEAATGVQTVKEDLTGDGIEDIRIENSKIFIQMNGGDIDSRIVASECGNQVGADVMGRIQTNPQSPISFSKSPSAEFRSTKEFEVITDKDMVGSYRIVREYVLFGSDRDDEIPFEISSTVTLFAEDTFALIELDYDNLGDESVKLDQDIADIHDGFMVLKQNDLVGRNQGQNDYRFYLSGQRTRKFENQFTFETYPGTDWATVFDNEDAATYGLIDGHTSPKMWVQTNGGIDYELHEFRLDPGESASYTVVAGVHDGGSAAPDIGQQIYRTATNRAAGELPELTPPGGTGPEMEFDQLRKEKLALAQRLRTASGGTIQEVERVQETLDALEIAKQSGNIADEKAIEAVQRLKFGENVTERTLAGAGPALPEVDSETDYDVATTTANSAVDAAFSILFALLPLNSVAKRIPFGRKVVDTAKKWGKRGLEWLIKAALSSVDSLSRFVRREVDGIASELYDEVAAEVIERAETVTQEQTERTANVNGTLVDLLLNLIEADTNEVLNATDLSEALINLDQVADPDTDATFTGSIDDARTAADQGLADAETTFEFTTEAFAVFDQVLDLAAIADVVITLATFVGIFTGGILSVIAQLAGLLLDIAIAALQLLKAGAGWLSLADLRDNHAQTLQNITMGTPQRR